MSETEERAAGKELWENLGFRLLDDSDWTFDDEGKRMAARSAYWCVVSEHDDERLDQPIRYGQWPGAAEIAIRRLWQRCVALSAEKAARARLDASKNLKLSVIASVVLTAPFAIPLLLRALHLINMQQFSLLWHYGAYFAAAALGALIAGWWSRF